MNYNIRLNLLHLKGAQVVKTKEPKGRFIMLPLGADSLLFEGKAGVYLNLSAWERLNPSYGETHYIKQTIGKQLFESMTTEQRRELPIVGGMAEYVGEWSTQAQNAPEIEIENQ